MVVVVVFLVLEGGDPLQDNTIFLGDREQMASPNHVFCLAGGRDHISWWEQIE